MSKKKAEYQLLEEPPLLTASPPRKDTLDIEEIEMFGNLEEEETLRRSDEDIKHGRLHRWEDIKRDVSGK